MIPMSFTTITKESMVLIMAGWFIALMCVAALVGIRAEEYAALKCFRNLSKDLLYQRETLRDPGVVKRLQKQAEEAGITVNLLTTHSTPSNLQNFLLSFT